MKKWHAPLRRAIPAALVVGIVCAVVIFTRESDRGSRDGRSAGTIPPGQPGGIARARADVPPAADRIDFTQRHLTEKERAGFLRRLLELPDEEAVALLKSLAKRDLTAAFELALALGGSGGKGGVAREAMRGLMELDLDAALAWGETRDPSPEMELFWAAAIDFTAGPTPSMAFELSGKTGGGLRLDLLKNIFAEWAGEDLAAAKSAALALASNEERAAAHLAILRSELARDLGKTLSWIGSIADPDLQDALYYHAVPDWAAQDPLGAAGFAGSLAESDFKTHVAGMVLESWIRNDPGPAMAWASALPDQESREEAISRGIRQTFESSPEEAATLSLRLSAEGDRAAAIEQVISAWIERDPAALARWISEVPDSTTRAGMTRMMQDHVESVIGVWSKQDPEALARWLAQLPDVATGDGIPPTAGGGR